MNICTNEYEITFDLDNHDKIIRKKAIEEFDCVKPFNLAEHDSELLDKVGEKIKAEMIETYTQNINGVKAPTPFTHFSYKGICNLLDKVIAEMKAGE